MFFATPFNIDPNKWSDATAIHCKDKTLAQQQFKDECNINVLMQRYLETGEIPQVTDGLSYGNFEGIFDFQTAMNAVKQAELVFGQLPARIKNRFDNDPQKLLEFLAVDDNREEAEFLGLINKKEPTNDAGTPATTQTVQKEQKGDSGTAGTAGTDQATQKP